MGMPPAAAQSGGAWTWWSATDPSSRALRSLKHTLFAPPVPFTPQIGGRARLSNLIQVEWRVGVGLAYGNPECQHGLCAFLLHQRCAGPKVQHQHLGALSTDAYSGGEFDFHNSSNDPSSLLAAAAWDCPIGCDYLGRGADLAFKASISLAPLAVPEPTALVLTVAGLGLVGAAVRRRRTAA